MTLQNEKKDLSPFYGLGRIPVFAVIRLQSTRWGRCPRPLEFTFCNTNGINASLCKRTSSRPRFSFC